MDDFFGSFPERCGLKVRAIWPRAHTAAERSDYKVIGMKTGVDAGYKAVAFSGKL
jgi:hypothetical protein